MENSSNHQIYDKISRGFRLIHHQNKSFILDEDFSKRDNNPKNVCGMNLMSGDTENKLF